jgi:hypothetical protein
MTDGAATGATATGAAASSFLPQPASTATATTDSANSFIFIAMFLQNNKKA